MAESTPHQTKQELPPLSCPHCAIPLHLDGTAIHCPSCKSRAPIQSGIHNFLASGNSSSDKPDAHLNEFNQIASMKGWRAAAETIASRSADPAHKFEYISSEARADFRFLLPVNEDSIVLDMCAGWGNISAAFARTCKHIYSLDTSWDKLVFSRLRASQERLENITYLRAHPRLIPLPDASCQIAVLADMIECSFWEKASTNSKYDHQQILKSIWGKLVPGGCLYLGVENRFSYKYVLGGKAPPSNLRFISLLPRSVANRYSRLLRDVDYQEVTYSLKEITKLLRQAGFSSLVIYHPIPAYPRFRFLADLSSRARTEFMISRLRVHSGFSRTFYFFAKIASALGILPWFAPGFGIIAYKE